MTDEYGQVGPKHLDGKTREVSPEELLNGFRRLFEPDWAKWTNEECLRRIRKVFAQDWVRKIVCSCGKEESFAIFHVDPEEVITRAPFYDTEPLDITTEHVDLVCQSCGEEIELFDERLNGWNAVICEEKDFLPPNYRELVRAKRQQWVCNCGNTGFEVLVIYIYDADDPDWLPKKHWGEAFGSFSCFIMCPKCGKADEVVAVETA